MQQFLNAHASGAVPEILLERCLEQLGEVPAEATLGFAYATSTLAAGLPLILNELRRHLPHLHWLGSVAEGVCSSGEEFYDEPALVLLVGDFEPQQYCLLHSSDDIFVQLPERVQFWCRAQPDCFGLLHAVPTHMGTGTFVKELLLHAPNASLCGGLSSGSGSYRHIADQVYEHGISGVLFSAAQPILCDHTQGCTPIGDTLTIDEAHQNMVLRLDGRPALEVLRETVGEMLWRDQRRLSNYIFIGLPADPCHSGDYLVRNLMGLDQEEGAIAVGDLMEHRRQLRFCRRDGNAAREDMIEMLLRLKQKLAGRPVRGAIYISCIGRGRRQFGSHSEELKLIKEHLGEFPLAGFFATGEFYRGRLYSYTGVLTLFL